MSEEQSKRHRGIQGIRQRWMVNSLGAVFLVACVTAVAFTMVMAGYYYSSMESSLISTAQQSANFFTSHYTTESAYRENAINYASDTFNYKDTLELQFLTSTGQVFQSSRAFSGYSPKTPEISEAVQTQTIRTWSGQDPSTGQHVMAVSAPLVYNGSVRGIMRFVTALDAVNLLILKVALVSLAAVLVVVCIVYFSNLYFIKSILEPMSAITETAKRIAAGSYGVQIEKKYNDEIGELADTINDMSLKISQSEKLKSEFISSVSHELRTPLTAINGWGETLIRGEVTSAEDVKKGMNTIVSEAQRLTKMVEELLEFSRIEDGRFTLQIEPVDIKAELEDAVYTYREFFRKEGITLEYHDCEEEFPPIPGDPERLRQVFSNLLDNAAKHGGSGKRIAAFIGREEGYVVIRIRDYGPGIPENELPYVKAKFYKGSSKARGSGIGLAVCDEIVTRLNGRLDVGNAEGGGCVVTIYLPMSAQE